MKKSFNIFLAGLVLMLSMAGCTGKGDFHGKEYKSYGIFDEHKYKNPNVAYEVAVAPIVASIVVMVFLSTGFGLLGLFVTVGWFLNVPTNEIVPLPENRGLVKGR